MALRNRKLRVLLIPSDYWSGIGAMARHLTGSIKGVDFYFLNIKDIKTHQEQFLGFLEFVDIVHWLANLSWANLASGFNIRELPVVNIATVHHVDENLTGQREKEEASKISTASECDLIQVVSNEWLDYVKARTDKPVFLAHHAINPQNFKHNRQPNRPRDPFQIGTFGFAKTINDRKRVDILVDALSILQKEKYRFELVVQGPYWNQLQDAFAFNGISVKNLGFKNHKQALKGYRYLDLYVCSSDIEGGPLPVLEALASGVPVVSTRVGVASEAISIGGGLLVEKSNPSALAAAIRSMIDNRSLYQRYMRETVKVSERYSWKNVEDEYHAMYYYALDLKKHKHVRRYYFLPKIQRSFQLARSAFDDTLLAKSLNQIKRKVLDVTNR